MALPRSLPPPPSAPVKTASAPTAAKPFDPLALFLNMRNSYLDMLDTPNNTTNTTAPQEPAVAVESTMAATALPVQADASAESDLMLSPELRELLEFVSPEFATPLMGGSDSPFEETPLFTPMHDFGTPISNVWETSPVFEDCGDFPPLFATAVDALSLTNAKDKPLTTSPEMLMNTLYTMPTTPALAPVALFPESMPPVTGAATKGGPAPNGHRKGVSAATLIPLDAPTQTRNYYTDSKTSRKAVPAAFINKARKRTREEAAFDEDEDVLLTPDLEDAIASKRRQNTIAARRSRARKAETARQQEELITHLSDENTRLRQELELLKNENEALRRRVAH